MVSKQKIIELAKECGYQHPDAVGTCEDFAYFDLYSFYQKAQAEALRNAHVQIPTETMEQAFSNYQRLGYNKGKAEAFEDAAKCCSPDIGIHYDDYVITIMTQIAAAIRKRAKEKQNG